MFPRVRVPPEEDEAPPPPPLPQPANTRTATTNADINASNLLLMLINLPSSANNSQSTQLLTSARHCRIRFLHFRHIFPPDTGVSTGRCPFGSSSPCFPLGGILTEPLRREKILKGLSLSLLARARVM